MKKLLMATAATALLAGGAFAEAERTLETARTHARAQGARSWELRAATSMARLRRDQDRVEDGRSILAPVYASFTEGFDTGDLREARALLDELT